MFVSQLVAGGVQERGTWRMPCQGVETPLLKLDTVVEHGEGQGDDSGDHDTVTMKSVEEVDSDTADDGKPHAKPKAPALADRSINWGGSVRCWSWLTFSFSFQKAVSERAATEPSARAEKKRKVSQDTCLLQLLQLVDGVHTLLKQNCSTFRWPKARSTRWQA